MNSNKSFGYDGISAKILKKVAKESSKPLTHIFNLSFLNGIIPDKLKFALVTPMHKGNEESKVDNYRPISVLNYFSKLLEQFVAGRLTKFIDKNDILSKHQYGFRKNRSTELQYLTLLIELQRQLMKESLLLVFFLVYQKLLMQLITRF